MRQKEEKLNGAFGPVIKNSLHDSLSRGTMCVVNTDSGVSTKA